MYFRKCQVLCGKKQSRRKPPSSSVGGGAILNRVVGVGLTEKVSLRKDLKKVR